MKKEEKEELEKAEFRSLEDEIMKDESVRELLERDGIRFKRGEIRVKRSDWNWLIYACSQFAKVIGWMYGSLSAKEVKEIEDNFDTEIESKRMRAFLRYLFKGYKKRI